MEVVFKFDQETQAKMDAFKKVKKIYEKALWKKLRKRLKGALYPAAMQCKIEEEYDDDIDRYNINMYIKRLERSAIPESMALK